MFFGGEVLLSTYMLPYVSRLVLGDELNKDNIGFNKYFGNYLISLFATFEPLYIYIAFFPSKKIHK